MRPNFHRVSVKTTFLNTFRGITLNWGYDRDFWICTSSRMKKLIVWKSRNYVSCDPFEVDQSPFRISKILDSVCSCFEHFGANPVRKFAKLTEWRRFLWKTDHWHPRAWQIRPNCHRVCQRTTFRKNSRDNSETTCPILLEFCIHFFSHHIMQVRYFKMFVEFQ